MKIISRQEKEIILTLDDFTTSLKNANPSLVDYIVETMQLRENNTILALTLKTAPIEEIKDAVV